MRAFVLTRYGGPDLTEFRDLPAATPKADELLVRVHSAGLNPVDYKYREGKLRPIYRPELSAVMGNELAGTVVGCGDRVRGFGVDDRVFVRGHKAEMGAFAEFACVPEPLAAKVPASLPFTDAGGVPLAGLTALQVLRDELQVGPGMRILIAGGTGGVGTFAIQIAKAMGAHVSTTTSPAGIELAKSLGADEVINYKHQSLAETAEKFDGAFDLVGGKTLESLFGVVKSGGKVVSIAGVPEPVTARKDLGRGPGLAAIFWLISLRCRLLARRHGVTYRYLFMHGSGPDLEQLSALVEQGKLRVVVDRVFPFAEIREAFVHLEAGHAKGKVIVAMEG